MCIREAVRGAARLALVNAELPAGLRLTPREMGKVQEQILAVNDAVLDKGGSIDPTAYLAMATAASSGQPANPARALELTLKGIKATESQNLPESDPRQQGLLDLRLEAAWLLLLDHKVAEAEEHLAVVEKHGQSKNDVALYRGLGAVLDGRLEQGVQFLTKARTAARYKESLPLLLGLSHAYLGQGQLENALPVLEELYKIRKGEEPKNREDQVWLSIWQPKLTDASLNILKCQLGLALGATKPRDVAELERRANEYYRDLKTTYLGGDATAVLLNYKLARLQQTQARDPEGLQADTLRQEIQEIMESVGAADRNDPRLLWTEINVILSEKEQNPAAIGAAIAGPFGAPTDMAVRLGELGRLRAGLAWQWQKAEQRLMQAAAAQKDRLPIQLDLGPLVAGERPTRGGCGEAGRAGGQGQGSRGEATSSVGAGPLPHRGRQDEGSRRHHPGPSQGRRQRSGRLALCRGDVKERQSRGSAENHQQAAEQAGSDGPLPLLAGADAAGQRRLRAGHSVL